MYLSISNCQSFASGDCMLHIQVGVEAWCALVEIRNQYGQRRNGDIYASGAA